MNVLAFDTCFTACSVAVGIGIGTPNARIEAFFEGRDRGHAERLVPMIGEALSQAGAALKDMDRIAITNGPGSFMGVRVGVAAAKGLWLASGVPVVAVSSLAVMAQEAFEEVEDRGGAQIIVAVDARRDQVYAQLFGRDGIDALTPPALLGYGEASRLAQGLAVAVGSGAEAVARAAAVSGRTIEVRLPRLSPDAATLLFMAPHLQPQASVQPLYLREPDAKIPLDPAAPRV